MLHTTARRHRTLSLLSLMALGLSACDGPEAGAGPLVLGTTEPMAPATFAPLADGQPVDVVFGGQGSQMLVAAARTNHFGQDVDTVTVRASLTALDGTTLAAFTLRQKLWADADGSALISDLYLVLGENGGSAGWNDTDATLSIRLSTLDGGDAIEASVRIHLVAQDDALPGGVRALDG